MSNNRDSVLMDEFKKGFSKIYNTKQVSRNEYILLYQKMFEIFIVNNGKSTAENHPSNIYYYEINSLLVDHVISLKAKLQRLTGQDLLKRYVLLWDQYRFSTKIFNGACSYLNRHWGMMERINGEDGFFNVYELAMIMWRDHIFIHFSDKLTVVILKLVEDERNGLVINTSLISNILNCYLELGWNQDYSCGNYINFSLYRNIFVILFLEETEKFYTRESLKLIKQYSAFDYLTKVESILEEEEKRTENYLQIILKEPLMQICIKTLIKDHHDFINSEFIKLLNANDWNSIKKIFLFYVQINNNFDKLAEIFEDHIKKEGITSINNIPKEESKNAQIFMKIVLKIRKKYKRVIETIFESNIKFFNALDKASMEFINFNCPKEKKKNSVEPAVLLAKYFDIILRRKNISNEYFENARDECLAIFNFLNDKEIFEDIYRQLFAKRLVNQLAVNDESETSIIENFKQICGFCFTSRLQSMLQDIQISKDLNEKFKNYLENYAITLNVDFSIKVLTKGFLPSVTNFNFSLPEELQSSVQNFTNFYKTQHSERVLTWLHNNSQGEIIANLQKRYTFQISTFQIGILLPFNSSLTWTIQELQNITQLDMDHLIQVIQFFVTSKLFLVEEPDKLTPTTTIKLFTAFKNKRPTVNFIQTINLNRKVEIQSTKNNFIENRKLILQATIVRIMKTKKTLKHSCLVVEVINQLKSKFEPKSSDIKECISILIDKEYLERKDGENDTYNYLA